MSRRTARLLGYITHAVGRKGHDRYWHTATKTLPCWNLGS
jgi:hypothetical protein